jgi:hypothetical protein
MASFQLSGVENDCAASQQLIEARNMYLTRAEIWFGLRTRRIDIFPTGNQAAVYSRMCAIQVCRRVRLRTTVFFAGIWSDMCLQVRVCQRSVIFVNRLLISGGVF